MDDHTPREPISQTAAANDPLPPAPRPAGALVYRAIAAITAELAQSGIAKARQNDDDGYAYRGIDDIYNALGPLLGHHSLCILPSVIERQVIERSCPSGDTLNWVTVRTRFSFVSAEDGSTHHVETFGEAIDASDKATNKAMSAAYKYAVLQTFCVPVSGTVDADASSPKVQPVACVQDEPEQGWAQWAIELASIAEACDTEEALTRLQITHRQQLRTLQQAQPDLYAAVGNVICNRRSELRPPEQAAA